MTTDTSLLTSASNVIGSSPSSGVAAASKAATAKASLFQTYDAFITLLTTQLKNQDPLSPMDSAKFTEQLVQFSGVEQSINQNKNLEQLINLTKGNQNTSALGYIGRVVETDGATAITDGTGAKWVYALPTPSAKTSLVVTETNTGRVVYAEEGATAAGRQTFNWNGTDNNGTRLPAGSYTLAVAATDQSDGQIKVPVTLGGLVSGVDNTGGDPMLMIGGMRVPASKILSVMSGT